ncbi:MAG: acyl-CoA dehydrogenase [Chloroflexi bacterium]|nr:MAG: acyl-CoA dehydrogenase [Anaerolineaceae bacterium 4572_32.2]RLC73933.1 MAG: acyl-CoA dehydrogenase [Chloroflexota bacterium]RLC77989.1 MAG: acyl-CoA dehydrogenase [Chloroflexota bacterium]HEY72137.1 acyl-CoA dehydrogenase [Thermoflexia bacterium]
MIDFSLTDEQKFIRKLARDFAQKEMAPRAEHYDEAAEYPWEVIEKAHQSGLLNTIIPEEFGGVGAGALEESLVAEELFAGDAGMGSAMLANNLGLMPIVASGTDEQKERFLAPFLEKPIMAAFCLTESGAGSDVANLRTSWRRDGDEYVINGSKMFITNGGVASLYTVFATAEPGKRKYRAFGAFVIPRDAPGVSTGKKENKMGQRCSDTSEVIFDEVRVPADHLLGQEGAGFKVAMKTLDRSRPTIAASSVGIARAAMEAAVPYAQERQTFGRPLAGHQAIQFMLADMAIKIETARLITWKAAWLADQGLPNNMESSIAKCYATDIAMQVTTDAVQIFGGYGYSKEYPVERYMRDAKLMQIYEGANQIQRMVISRNLLA